jgi:hypothetical protein
MVRRNIRKGSKTSAIVTGTQITVALMDITYRSPSGRQVADGLSLILAYRDPPGKGIVVSIASANANREEDAAITDRAASESARARSPGPGKALTSGRPPAPARRLRRGRLGRRGGPEGRHSQAGQVGNSPPGPGAEPSYARSATEGGESGTAAPWRELLTMVKFRIEPATGEADRAGGVVPAGLRRARGTRGGAGVNEHRRGRCERTPAGERVNVPAFAPKPWGGPAGARGTSAPAGGLPPPRPGLCWRVKVPRFRWPGRVYLGAFSGRAGGASVNPRPAA